MKTWLNFEECSFLGLVNKEDRKIFPRGGIIVTLNEDHKAKLGHRWPERWGFLVGVAHPDEKLLKGEE